MSQFGNAGRGAALVLVWLACGAGARAADGKDPAPALSIQPAPAGPAGAV